MAEHTLEFVGIGTRWQIVTDRPISSPLAARVQARIEEFDVTYSRFRADSLVSKLRRGAARVPFPSDAVELLGLYRRLYDVTAGAVTPLVGGALEHLGYDADYSLRRSPGEVVVPAWDDVLTVDAGVVTTSEPLVLDVGAVGKGYLVDQVAELLRSAGVESYLVDASGDMLRRGAGQERIGLEDPMDPDRLIGVVQLDSGALCASSTERRRWGEGLHHVVDPVTAEPTTDTMATWVLATSCAVADGLATALFFAPPEQLADAFSFTYVRLGSDRSVEWSTDLDGQIFT